MKEWTGTLEQTTAYPLAHWYDPEQVLLFDIETTGFSPQNTTLYLIGCCYFSENVWHYRMLFNDDGRSEYQILTGFFQLLRQYSVLLHFNGDGFDLPYLKEKCRQYQSFQLPLKEAALLTEIKSVDLYKLIRCYKQGLSIPNLKLTTIQTAMKIPRKDTYTGGELIRVYQDYLKHPDANMETLLFQHNYEDILAMIPLLQILNFSGLQEQAWNITALSRTGEQIRIVLNLHYPLPLPYHTVNSYFEFHGCEDRGEVRIPVFQGEMRYYLPDWKDYYYLPLEDTVIHKSVAAYVDAPYKEKAGRQNCFIKKEGSFLPCPEALSSSLRSYRREYKDTTEFVELSEIDSDNPSFWLEYLKHTFRSMQL